MAVTVDQMLENIGSFERYQWLLLGFCGYATMAPSALTTMVTTFIIAEPYWICVKAYSNSVCNFTEPITLTSDNYNARCSMPRDAWSYEDGFTSVVTEYDLVCDKSYLQSIARSCYWIGCPVALLFGGYAADRFGRKIMFCLGTSIMVLMTWVMVFPKAFAVLIAGLIITGIGMGLKSSADFVLLTEFTGKNHRGKIGIMGYYFWGTGSVVLALFGYLLPNWRHLLLATAVTATPVILTMWWFLPESIRWLLLHGKPDAAREELAKIARINKRPFPDDNLKQPDAEERGNFLHLFLNLNMTKITLISWNIRITTAIVYFGVSYGSVDLGWNRYLVFALTSIVELPAGYTSILAMDRYGRKKSTALGLIISCLALIVAVAIPHEQTSKVSTLTIFRIIMAVIAKFAIAFAYGLFYVWTVELYPTTIRSIAFSAVAAIEPIGSIIANYLIWLIRIHEMIPFGIMGFMCFQSAILSLFLPETKGQATTETMAEMGQKKDDVLLVPIFKENSVNKHNDPDEIFLDEV